MGHFYHLDGTPNYTVTGSNGKERDTTLRDARKLNLVPSVTTIIGQLAKPQLEKWKAVKLLETVEQHKGMIGKGDSWKEQLMGISQNENMKYSKEGTRVHDALENYFKTGMMEPENEEMLWPLIETINSLYPNAIFEAEPSFAHKDGFGGKMDLLVHTDKGTIILDFKTKQGSKLDAKSCYQDYMLQLAAYKEGLGKPVIRCGNVLISVTDPGIHYIHMWTEEDIQKGWKMFKNLLELYKLTNNFMLEG